MYTPAATAGRSETTSDRSSFVVVSLDAGVNAGGSETLWEAERHEE